MNISSIVSCFTDEIKYAWVQARNDTGNVHDVVLFDKIVFFVR